MAPVVTAMRWTRRAAGYYEAQSYSGIALLIRQEPYKPHSQTLVWRLYAGDRVEPRAWEMTLRDIKRRAEAMFG